MREFMYMVLSAQLFVICISGGMWFFGSELGITAIADRSLDMDALTNSFNATAQDYQTDPFNAIFIFGDFGRAITEFLNIVSGGYIFSMMGLFGFAQSFITGVQVAFGLGVIMTLVYLISGRG